MMLVPCGGCSRHVRAEEGPCPFCGAAVSLPPRAIARHGATRAAIFYLGATLAACGGQSDPPPESTIMQPYGAPPDPPEAPPDPSEPDVADPPPPPLETDPDPDEPPAIAPPYGAPALPDSEH